jgi:hypothetical protein
MKHIALAVLGIGGITLGSSLVMAQAPVERREVAEHVHGESMMRIAVEGTQMAIDFDAPGLDVLGFEHPPASAAEQAAVEAAIVAMENPIPALFDFGAEAGCTVTTAEVEFLVEEEPAEGPAPAPNAMAGAPAAAEEITNHTGFEGVYEIACANPAAIREIRFGFFATFPNSSVIEVELATGRGQSTFDVERASGALSLAGLI